ncbi:MAG: XdhC family protein [Candidatus Methanomethyliaceae archaeon]
MDDIFERLVEIKKSGTPSALAIVIRTEGSAPRKPGAKMIVCKDGSIIGTLGGGGLENAVIKEAMDTIQDGKPKIAFFTLDIEKGKLDMMCGGTVEVYIEPILPSDKLIIFGAGHITRSLVPIMKKIGFQVMVVDDNPDFLKKNTFPILRICILLIWSHLPKVSPQTIGLILLFSQEDFQRTRQLSVNF